MSRFTHLSIMPFMSQPRGDMSLAKKDWLSWSRMKSTRVPPSR